MAEGYNSRLTDGVVPLAPRRASSVASAIGRGLGMLADAGQSMVQDNQRTNEQVAQANFQTAAEIKRRDAARLSADFSGKYADARIEVERRIADARKSTAPGAPGWDQTVTEIQGDVYGKLLDQYGPEAQKIDDQLALRFGGMVRSASAETLGREIDWQGRTAQAHEGDSFDQMVTVEANGLMGVQPDKMPDSLKMAMLRVRTALDGTDYDGTTKSKLLHLAYSKLTQNGALAGLEAQGDYAGIGALVGSGELDPLLGDNKDNWIKTARTGTEMQQRQAAAAQADALRESLDRLNTMKVQIANGDVPGQADIQAAIADAKAKGAKASDLVEFAYLGEKGLDAKEFGSASNATLQAEQAQLKAQQAAGKLDPRGARRLDTLDNVMKARDADAADKLTGLKSGDPAAAAMDLAKLAAMDPAQRMRVARAASDPAAGILAGLPTRNGQIALEGQRVLQADKTAFMPVKPGKDKGDPDLAEQDFRTALGPSLTAQLMRSGNYAPAMQAAMALYAGSRARGGGHGWSQGDFRAAVNVIFGATKRGDGTVVGGLGTVRGTVVQLPDNETAASFDAKLSRSDFSAARAGGQAVNRADVLADYAPVYAGNSGGLPVYAFIDGQGRELKFANGNPFRLAFGKGS